MKSDVSFVLYQAIQKMRVVIQEIRGLHLW